MIIGVDGVLVEVGRKEFATPPVVRTGGVEFAMVMDNGGFREGVEKESTTAMDSGVLLHLSRLHYQSQ